MDYYTLSEKLSQLEFDNLLRDLQDKYTNDEPLITDAEFDYLVDTYNNKFNSDWNYIGALPNLNKTKVNLNFFMSSLNKIKIKEGNISKANIEINIWLLKNPSDSYIIEDKIDGCSLLYESYSGKQSLSTRGNGEIGEDISYLLEHLNLPIPNCDFSIRGEITLKNTDFKDYVNEQKRLGTHRRLNVSRNAVAGLVNRDKNINIELLNKCLFIGYEILYFSKKSEMNPGEQLNFLKELGFQTPWYLIVNNLTANPAEFLNFHLNNQKNKSIYDIDGIVIITNKININNKFENPEYAFAYKIDTYAETTVLGINWTNSSKDGKIIPTVSIVPIIMGNSMKNPSGKNARFIFNNKIGIGARILVTFGGDVIPDIVRVIEGATEDMMVYPNLPENSYCWNSTGVHFILVDTENNQEVQKSRFLYFIKHLEIDEIGPSTIDKFYDNGYDSLFKILSMKIEQITELIGLKNAQKIYNNLHKAITNAPLYKIMTSSCIFGEGYAEKRFQSILENYSEIIQMIFSKKIAPEKELFDKITNIDGFSDIMANKFIKNLERFIVWLFEHPQITVIEFSNGYVQSKNIDCNYPFKKVVFSGFRDKILKSKLEGYGIEVADRVSKNKKVDYLITQTDEITNKVTEAIKFGSQIITKSNFLKNYPEFE